MARLRLVFAGTPDFAVPGLAACLAADVDVVAAYTQPDRPTGRGRKVRAGPVKRAAVAAGIPIEQPLSLREANARQRLRAYQPDLVVVIAYGLMLPASILKIPRLGGWNVHASLLPRWRGAAPIQRAILAGDRTTGVCLMRMEVRLDTGPVLLRATTPIHDDDTGGSLHDRLAGLAAGVLGEGLRHIVAGETLPATPQAEAGVTYASKLDKAEARLDFTRPAAVLARQVRAFDPWPVAAAELAGERVRVWGAQVLAAGPTAATRRPTPGSILAVSRQGIDIACGDGVLRILQLQRAGARVITAADYLNARPGLRSA